MTKDLFLANPKLNFIIFGGKGGSGKTTSACATALYLSQKYKKKFLVISIDPAPSVGDSFDVEVGNKLTQIKDNIWAQELDAKELMEDFRKKNLETIKTIADRGTYLDREDIEEFASLSVPGMDEVMAVIKIADLLKEEKPARHSPEANRPMVGGYDLIILDTAPTGHTKALLSLPEKMKRWLKVADLMMAKHRFMMKRIKGKYIRDECDKFLEEIGTGLKRVEDLLKNSETTEFIPVTIPEPMSILETEGLVDDLKEMAIPVKSIICNRVVIAGECPFCKSRAKEEYLKTIEEKFKDYHLFKIPLFPTEVRGESSLNEYAKILFGEKQFEIKFPKKLPKFPKIPEGKMADFLKKDLNFIICGGKGGVGKTSLAAATAIAFAKKHKDKKILVTTTDPAQALSNIFDQDILFGRSPVPIGEMKNLEGLEIDASKLLQDFKDKYKKNISETFGKFLTRGVDVAFDRKVIEELMDLSPAGLEELMALSKIMDLMVEGKYDIYVLDSAASGHLLRFLELPNLIREWLKSIFKILLKYRKLAKPTELTEMLIGLSKGVKRIQKTLFDSKKTEFIMIGIAEEMGRREMEDLAQSLEKLNINFSYIILNYINPVRDYRGNEEAQGGQISNGVNPPSDCSFCLTKRKDQEKYIKLIKKEYPSKKIVLIPLLPQDIRGMDSLNKLSKIIYKV